MNKPADIAAIAAFLLVVPAVWVGLSAMPSPKLTELWGGRVCDLGGADFEDTVYVPSGFRETYPERLYAPADLATAEPPVPAGEVDYTGVQYATHVMKRFYAFAPTSDVTTLVTQAANFVHHEGASPARFVIGDIKTVARRVDADDALTYLVMGRLFAGALYHPGLFAIDRKRRATPAFAACRLLFALLSNSAFTAFPGYNRQLAFRFEYLVHFATFAVTVLFLNMLHNGAFHRPVVLGYTAPAALYSLTLLLPTTVFTRVFIGFEAASVLIIVYVVAMPARLAITKRDAVSALSFTAVAAVGLPGFNDITTHFFNLNFLGILLKQGFNAPPGMLFFMFCYSLIIALSYALRSGEKPETVRASLAYADGEIMRVARLSESALRLAYMQEARQAAAPLNIGELPASCAESYRPFLAKRGNRLTTRIAANLPLINGDADRLIQAAANLPANANAHTAGGEIVIAASLNAGTGFVEVTVQDDGDGIAADVLPRAFERGVAGAGGKTGLGLPICKEIIENHGGAITIQSEPGKGAAVTFTLPPAAGGDGHE